MKLFCNLDKKTIIITESQRRKIQEMIAYHGSKMNFDEFNLAYMGTGVGAQEFGEGIYLTFDKEAAYGYGGTIYTVNIPDENKANYIYYNRPIPSDLFSAIIDNIVADITRQYPDEYTDEQSIEDLKKELYDIMDPSEGRHLMYNIHRYIDDSIVIPKILKNAGVAGFIYNNGKVDNVIMFSSKDIKILDKETVNENKNRIEEEYFTPNELLTEDIEINESLLLEATLDDIYTKYYSNIPQDEFWQIIKADPTYNEQRSQKMGKYGKWLLNQYRQGNLDMNNLSKVRNTIDFFNRYNRQLEVKDINQYKNIDQVYDNVKNFMEDPSQATSKSDEARKIKAMGAEKVYEDNDWLIIVPKTQKAAAYYGKGTKWCTASNRGYNYFGLYNNEGRLYININKNTGDKYQFHFESNSFMDAEDKPITGIIAEKIGLSSGAEQFYASLGEDQEYAISSEEHTDSNEEPEEEEILNQNGWQMIYNNDTGDITIYSVNENEDCMIFDDGSIEQMDGYPIVKPLHEFLPVFVIEKLQEYYSNETFYKMVLADYDPTDKGYDYYPIGNNGAVFKYYDDINSGVLYRVDEQTYQFAKIIDFISFDLKLKDKISREHIDNLLFLNEYDEQLCYNVNNFTWAFDEPVDKFCFTNAVKATALKNGQGFVKIFKNNTVIQVPLYNNMPINTLDYDDYANAVIVEVLNNGEKAYAVYSVAKNQYVNNKLYASACYMRKENAIAMVSDKSERMTDSSLNLTKQGSDYMMDLFYKYGYIIYYNPDSSDQIIFANGKSVTRKDYFKYEEIYDFLIKVRQQPKITYF